MRKRAKGFLAEAFLQSLMLLGAFIVDASAGIMSKCYYNTERGIAHTYFVIVTSEKLLLWPKRDLIHDSIQMSLCAESHPARFSFSIQIQLDIILTPWNANLVVWAQGSLASSNVSRRRVKKMP